MVPYVNNGLSDKGCGPGVKIKLVVTAWGLLASRISDDAGFSEQGGGVGESREGAMGVAVGNNGSASIALPSSRSGAGHSLLFPAPLGPVGVLSLSPRSLFDLPTHR